MANLVLPVVENESKFVVNICWFRINFYRNSSVCSNDVQITGFVKVFVFCFFICILIEFFSDTKLLFR